MFSTKLLPLLPALALFACGTPLVGSWTPQSHRVPPPEYGRVSWERDLAAGLARAERESKPVVLLFQEVPG